MIYMVEHGFNESEPKSEAEWNEWYTEHATFSFRKVPGWHTGQRFRALPPSRPKYRAMYSLDNAAVFDTPEYKSTTGGKFPETWRALITDFHRNFADGGDMPAVAKNECLIVVTPPATGNELTGVKLDWRNIVGLEKSLPRIGLGVVDRATGEAIAKRALPGVNAYEPVFDRWKI